MSYFTRYVYLMVISYMYCIQMTVLRRKFTENYNLYSQSLTFVIKGDWSILYVAAMVDNWPLFLKTVLKVFTSEDFPDPFCPITMRLTVWHSLGGTSEPISVKSLSFSFKHKSRNLKYRYNVHVHIDYACLLKLEIKQLENYITFLCIC